MKKYVASLMFLLGCLSSHTMEVSQENTRLCLSFWDPKIEASENKLTEILESMDSIDTETKEETKITLNSLWTKQSIRVNKQKEAKSLCIKMGVNESFAKYSKYF